VSAERDRAGGHQADGESGPRHGVGAYASSMEDARASFHRRAQQGDHGAIKHGAASVSLVMFSRGTATA
jgi:hypothetical protein